jgi:hypothetical protein
MRVHITNVTKQFLPEKTYKIAERGVLDIPGKACLKTYLVVGKYDKMGKLEEFPYMEAHETKKGNKETKQNPKWEGFRLL